MHPYMPLHVLPECPHMCPYMPRMPSMLQAAEVALAEAQALHRHHTTELEEARQSHRAELEEAAGGGHRGHAISP